MSKPLMGLLVLVIGLWLPPASHAQRVGDVFERVKSSVVVVRTKGREVSPKGPGSFSEVGSGVLISADGKVMTAAHVVDTADEVSVEFLNGEVVGATVSTSEPAADVSLLQLARVPRAALVAKLGDSNTVRVGDPIFVVGAPYGIGYTLTVGHISARHQPNTVYRGMSKAEFFQTDAAINQGNSGGPLFSMAGEVMGIVSHIISKSGGFEGLAFVVTSNMARELLLVQQSFWSGVDGFMVTGELAKIFNLPQPAGLLVQRVARDSPAAAAGLRGGTTRATIGGEDLTVGGDIILEVHGVSYAARCSPRTTRSCSTRARTRSLRSSGSRTSGGWCSPGSRASRSRSADPFDVREPEQRVQVVQGVDFSQNVIKALGTIVRQVSTDPTMHQVELSFSFRGIKLVDVGEDRLHPA